MALVLVIEDSLLSRRAIAKALQNEHHEIIEAINGTQGLEMVKERQPDCILLDLLMPDMDGREVLQTLRQQGITTPVIVITADIQHSSRQQCLELGAFTVIQKLPDPTQLRDAISGAVCAMQDVSP